MEDKSRQELEAALADLRNKLFSLRTQRVLIEKLFVKAQEDAETSLRVTVYNKNNLVHIKLNATHVDLQEYNAIVAALEDAQYVYEMADLAMRQATAGIARLDDEIYAAKIEADCVKELLETGRLAATKKPV